MQQEFHFTGVYSVRDCLVLLAWVQMLIIKLLSELGSIPKELELINSIQFQIRNLSGIGIERFLMRGIGIEKF